MIVLYACIYVLYGVEIDFNHLRGVAVRNLSADGVFISDLETRETLLKVPVPAFGKDFEFTEGCRSLESDIFGTNRTGLNWIQQTILKQRVKELFRQTAEPAPELADDRAEYLPEPFFTVRKAKMWHGIPRKIVSQDAVYPQSIMGSGISVSSAPELPIQPRLTDNQTNTFASLDCRKFDQHSLQFVISQSIQAIVLVLNNPDPVGGIISPKLRIVQAQGKLEISQMRPEICSTKHILGAFRRLTAIIFWCNNLHIKEPIEVRMMINVNKYDCPKFRPAQLFFMPLTSKINWSGQIKRNRRQFGEIALGIGLAASVASWGSSWFFHNSDTKKIAKIDNEVKLSRAHEADYEGLFAEEFQTTTFVNNVTEQILGLTHHEMCKFQVSTAQFEVESFVNKVVEHFLEEVEQTLLHSSVPIPGNPVQRTAIGLCRARNPGVLEHVCVNFYEDKTHYKVSDMRFQVKEGDIKGAIISILIKVPKIAEHELMTTHSISAVPLPLFKDSQGYYSFASYEEIPKNFGNFPILKRKISLDSCTQHGTTFFCPLNTLNDLYSSTSVCLNTLLMPKPSCPRRITKSYSSCVIHANDGLIMISHVGAIGIKESSGRFLNVQQFHDNLSTVKSSNVTLVTGTSQINVACDKSTFVFQARQDVITRYLPLINATRDFPMEAHAIEGFDAYKISDKQFDDLIGQLSHLKDDAIKEGLQFKKLQNSPEYHKYLFKDAETSTSVSEWMLPILAVTCVGFGCIIAVWCCCNYRRMKNEYLCARSSCRDDKHLETIQPSIVSEHVIRRRNPPARPAPIVSENTVLTSSM